MAGLLGAGSLLVGSSHLSFSNFLLATLSCADIFSDVVTILEMWWNWEYTLVWLSAGGLIVSFVLFLAIMMFSGALQEAMADNRFQLFFMGFWWSPWLIPKQIKQSIDNTQDLAYSTAVMPLLLLTSIVAAVVSITMTSVHLIVWIVLLSMQNDVVGRLYGTGENISKLLVLLRMLEDVFETAMQIWYGTKVGFTANTYVSLAFAGWELLGVGLAFVYHAWRGDKFQRIAHQGESPAGAAGDVAFIVAPMFENVPSCWG